MKAKLSRGYKRPIRKPHHADEDCLISMESALFGNVTHSVREQGTDDGCTGVCDLPGDQSVTLSGCAASAHVDAVFSCSWLTCSRRRHQVCVISTKDGAIVASNIPSRNRHVARPAKLVAEAEMAVMELP